MFFCPLCGARVEMAAGACGCGLDLVTHDPAEPARRATERLDRSRKVLVLGIAGVIVSVALFVIVQPELSWLDQRVYEDQEVIRRGPLSGRGFALLGLLMSATASVLALLWGTGLRLIARRRLTIIERFSAPPTARVV